MSRSKKEGAEPWVPCAYALVGLTALSFVILGSRPGGPMPTWIYTRGLIALGMTSALLLATALAWSAYRRPFLQRGRLGGLASVAGVLWVASFPLAYPSSHDGHPSRVAFRVPFEGEWIVRDAGNDRMGNTLVLHPATRFGYRFKPADAGSGEVVAPADGTVVRSDEARWVARVAEGEYLVLEGLGPVSDPTGPAARHREVGASVAAGDALGPGGSGPAGLVLYLADQDQPRAGEGIPLRFSDTLADGRSLGAANPARGQRVRAVSEIPDAGEPSPR